MRSLSILVLLSLSACWEPGVPLEPQPQPVALEAGAYDLVVRGVIGAAESEDVPLEGEDRGESRGSACPVDARSLVGAVAPAELRVARNGGVSLEFEGFVLRGDMGGGNLYVEGALAEEVDHPDDVDVDEPGSGSSEEGAPPASDCGDEPVPVEEGEDEPRGGDDVDCGESAPSAPSFAALDAAIRDPHFAEGELVLVFEGCELALSVALGPPREREEPVVVYEEDVDAG